MKILLRHIGNMGDMVFFIPPVLETLKRRYPDSHITFVTSWGYKNTKGHFGERNQGGQSLHIMIPNPHIDELIHWHDTKLSLDKTLCVEEGKSFATWNATYYAHQKDSKAYDLVAELDFGIAHTDNPLERMYEAVGLPNETYSNYKIYLTQQDLKAAELILKDTPQPRIAILESLRGKTTRNWDPQKVTELIQTIKTTYGVSPYIFSSQKIPYIHGRPLTLRENIATLKLCDVGIGVLSAPLHFAGAVGLPTISLYCDQKLHRGSLAYFLNDYVVDPTKRHRTILGPTPTPETFLKGEQSPRTLTQAEQAQQQYTTWQDPGKQSTKSCLAVITVSEVMEVLQDMLPSTYAK